MGIGFSFGEGGPRRAPPLRALLRDPSLLAILAGNLLSLAVALQQQWPLAFLLWPYWLQSLAIGWYARRRMLALQRFSTAGLTINDEPVAPTDGTRRTVANFFAVHYGGFHALYFLFLLAFGAGGEFGATPSARDVLFFAALGIAFVLAHRASHRRNLAADLRCERNLGALMFLPYLRIVPMHLAILFGTQIAETGAYLLFVGLKFLADLSMHVVEHRWLQSVPLAEASRRSPAAAAEDAPRRAGP